MNRFVAFVSALLVASIVWGKQGSATPLFGDNPFTLSSSLSETDSFIKSLNRSAAVKLCKEDPLKEFRYKQQKRTCTWVGMKNARRNTLCRKRKIRRRCNVTCKSKRCKNNDNENKKNIKIKERRIQGKKGTCFTLRDEGRKGSYVENLPKVQALNPNWVHSWSSKPADDVPSPDNVFDADGQRRRRRIPGGPSRESSAENNREIDFFPMLWGYYPSKIQQFIEEIKQQNQRVIFGYNEPDNAVQSNVSVEAAISGWPSLESSVHNENDDDYKSKTILVSPSCVNALGSWMTSFMNRADELGLRVDAIGVHYYGSTSLAQFRNVLKKVRLKYNYRPIIITEFAVADWKATSVETNRYKPEEVLDFMERAMNWMEKPEQDWILGYAWFSFDIDDKYGTSSALFDSSNKLTPLGHYYSNYRK